MTDILATTDPTLSLPLACGGVAGQVKFKQQPEDFQVTELLGYEAEGQGENLFLTIRKRNMNTQYLVRRIAKFAGVTRMDVGYAGLKDKNAITEQTFSVRLPGMPELNWSEIEDEEVQIVKQAWSRKKIRRGSLKGNDFQIRLRDFQGDRELLTVLLAQIQQQGVPNYFGSQRFGINGDNLVQVLALFNGELKKAKRDRRSMLISAARSYLFNLILSKRVKLDTWNKPMLGDVMLLDGSEAQFLVDDVDASIIERCQTMDIHPSGLMPGVKSRALEACDEVLLLEQAVLDDNPAFLNGLLAIDLNADRRSLRLMVNDLDWQFDADDLLLNFSLKSGSYATVVLRELVGFS